ncbi:MAG: hypothetical protein V3V62_05580 [bacterium]
MADRAHSPRRRFLKVLAVFFLAGALAGIVRELRVGQAEVDALGRELAKGEAGRILRAGAGEGGLEALLERHRSRLGLERIGIFGPDGSLVAQSPAELQHGEGGGAPFRSVLASMRGQVRDAASGREIGHLVVWRDVGPEAGRSILIGLFVGLAAAAISLLLFRPAGGRESAAPGGG